MKIDTILSKRAGATWASVSGLPEIRIKDAIRETALRGVELWFGRTALGETAVADRYRVNGCFWPRPAHDGVRHRMAGSHPMGRTASRASEPWQCARYRSARRRSTPPGSFLDNLTGVPVHRIPQHLGSDNQR